MIPEAAVEAAAKSFPGYTPEDGADDLEREINAACRSRARAALEAAAPHMQTPSTIVDQTVELAEIIRDNDGPEVSVLGVAEAVIAAGYRKAGAEADAWDEGWAARGSWPAITVTNPYRPTP